MRRAPFRRPSSFNAAESALVPRFDLSILTAGGVLGGRVLDVGAYTIGRSPSCDVIISSLECETLARLTLSPEGRIGVLPFVSEMLVGEVRPNLGTQVDVSGPVILRYGKLRLEVRRASNADSAPRVQEPEAAEGSARGPGLPSSRREPRRSVRWNATSACFIGASALIGILAFLLSAPGPEPASSAIARPGKNVDATDVRRLEVALASADVVSPVRVEFDEGRVVLKGDVTEAELDQLAAIARSMNDAPPVDLRVTTASSEISTRVAAVGLSPDPVVVDSEGRTHRAGGTFYGWSVVAIGREGIRLSRGERTKLLPLPAQEARQ